ncbi:MAG: hypothetical protein IJ438_10015 [Clostridia bacterium]|nr:hypothetical protein [Clostridia bacterium]
MPNTIEKFRKYTTMLDEALTMSALTGVLDSDPSLAELGRNAGEIVIPKMDMDGLGNYDRNNGYPAGSVTLEMETRKCDYERGRMFTIDAMDNEESAGLAYGRLAGEFIRMKVAPEMDAVRLAKYASLSPAANRAVHATFADGKAVVKAISDGFTKMTDEGVPESGRVLFITATLRGMIDNMDTYQSKTLLEKFSKIVTVPSDRFYSAVTLLSGGEGQTAGGYKKADDAVSLNFEIVYKPGLLQFVKHAAPKIITPEANQDADAWKFGYRVLGLNDVKDNALKGLYVSSAAAIPTAAAANAEPTGGDA